MDVFSLVPLTCLELALQKGEVWGASGNLNAFGRQNYFLDKLDVKGIIPGGTLETRSCRRIGMH